MLVGFSKDAATDDIYYQGDLSEERPGVMIKNPPVICLMFVNFASTWVA
jgi:hypothetical protein